MFVVFLAGVLGFFVFDLYRIYRTHCLTNRLELTFGSVRGVVVHVLVYCACGAVGVFVSLDVIMDCCIGFFMGFSDGDLSGSMMRAFAIGLAGPSGLTKGKVHSIEAAHGQEGPNGSGAGEINDLTGGSANRIFGYVRILLMR